MIINQRITLEDKEKLVKFTGTLLNLNAVVLTVLRIFLLVLNAVALYHSLKYWSDGKIDVLWILLLFVGDATAALYSRTCKRQTSCKYLKNLDKVLSAAEVPHYDIKADNTAVTVNDSYTLKWKDVYAAAFTKDFVVLSGKSKVCLMIQADDELKVQISEILKKNKTYAFMMVKSEVNKAAVKAFSKRNLQRMIRHIAVLVILAAIPIAYGMLNKSPIKDLTQHGTDYTVVLPEKTEKEENKNSSYYKDGVYIVEISTAQDLVEMSEDYKDNGQNYRQYKYVLTNDIDMSSVENFMPIGIVNTDNTDVAEMPQYGFCSQFDGQGHTIYNLNINYSGNSINESSQYHTRVGLFSHITKEGSVKNLNIENAFITCTEQTDGKFPHAMGILAGSCEGKIAMCAVQGEVRGVMQVGGLAGSVYENGLIDSCHANAKITGSNELGCLAGNLSFCTVKHSSAEGEVNGLVNSYMDTKVFWDKVTPYAVGGFTGRIHYAELEGCHSDVTLQIEGSGKTVGDFAGSCQSSPIIACSYNGTKATVNKPIAFYHGGYDEAVSYTCQLEAVN